MNEITNISSAFNFFIFQRTNLWLGLESIFLCLEDLCDNVNMQKILDKSPAEEIIIYSLPLSFC